ncbi:hypothetical protein H6F46_12290 [Limnothrix sp. FACHB-1083]|nr:MULTISPECIES: hypothetical protein [unclassified Limnothrix]MBD2161468.1 hypothetical protein [Limnothrix sp. FACHB-1083]MBD2192021.1 hypothetical protein [Limnothrix sp. FACHB-1088]
MGCRLALNRPRSPRIHPNSLCPNTTEGEISPIAPGSAFARWERPDRL